VSRLKDSFSSVGADIVRFGTDFSDPPGESFPLFDPFKKFIIFHEAEHVGTNLMEFKLLENVKSRDWADFFNNFKFKSGKVSGQTILLQCSNYRTSPKSLEFRILESDGGAKSQQKTHFSCWIWCWITWPKFSKISHFLGIKFEIHHSYQCAFPEV